MRIGIVGAGIAGLACADALSRRGHDVVLFDKGRGPGGRMSTRRIETAEGVAQFDHGAQYFTLRDKDFQQTLSDWIAAGVAAPWPAAGSGAYVGVPGMNAPVRSMAARHVVHWAALVTSLERRGDGWRLSVGSGPQTGACDVDLAVVAIPAEQAAALLADVAPDLASRAGSAPSAPCWTAMLAFSGPVAASGDCRTGEEVIGWAARNNAKPGRTGPESWVVQATPEWSLSNIDTDPEEVAADLAAALSDMLGVALPARIGTAAHRWRFARCAPDGPGVIFSEERRLGLCGDWLVGPRVESAWLSGVRLAERIGSQV